MKQKNVQIYKYIIKDIMENSEVTEKFIANKYMLSERTIRRYIKDLKDRNIIILVYDGKFKKWLIL